MFNKNLSKAVAKLDMCRPHLQNVYFNAESGEYVATNGHIMLVERTTDKPADSSTLLNPITGQVIEDAKEPGYVDYKRLYITSGETLDWSAQLCKVYKFTGEKRYSQASKIIEINGVFFNFDYLKTIVDFFDGESITIYCSKREEGCNWHCYQFLNASGSKRALVMPIELTESILSSDFTLIKTLLNFEQLRNWQK